MAPRKASRPGEMANLRHIMESTPQHNRLLGFRPFGWVYRACGVFMVQGFWACGFGV